MARYALLDSNLVINVVEWDGVGSVGVPGTSTILLNSGEECGFGYTYVSGGTPRFTAPTVTTRPGPALDDAEYVVAAAKDSLKNSRVLTGSTSITVSTATSGQAGIQRAALTGDVTASANSNATTIANDAVTYAKMQNVSAASRLLGRGDSGSGDVQEITLGTNLTMNGTTLDASGGGGSVPDFLLINAGII